MRLRFSYYWLALGVIFLRLLMDEVLSLHEQVSRSVSLPGGGKIYFGWIVPAMGLVLLVIVLYANFLFRLPSRVRLLLILAAILFVSGALGVELVAAQHMALEESRLDSPAYRFLVNVEEGLEGLGG